MSHRRASRPSAFSHLWAKAFAAGRRKATSVHPPRVRLQLECLEERVVPAVIDVTTLADGTGPGTLRAAIAQADTNDANGDTTNTINLDVAGTYNIGQSGLGALQIFANNPTQSGLKLTIQNTSGGAVAISGDNMTRVFDINPGVIVPANNVVLGAVTIDGVTIENGLAQPGDGATGSGGGIRDQGPVDLTLNNDILANNSASADGGGVSMENTTSTRWALVLNNTTVVNNHAGDAGGGIDEDGTGLVNISNSTIADNTCLNQGAGVWLDAIQVGPPIVFQSATLNVTNSVVRGNMAGVVGGGIGNAGNGAVTISNSTIASNFTAGFGGGFGDENNQGTLSVQNSLFLDNSAAGNGGGIEADGPSTVINNSEIRGNAAGINGGAIATGSGGGLFLTGVALTLTNSTIADNTATQNGGGIELENNAAATITNTTIVGNTALNNNPTATVPNDGGGIDDAAPGTVALVNDTITNNFAVNGGGLFFAGTTGLTLQNTILAQNLASNTGPDFDFTGAITGVDLGGNLIGVGDPAIFTVSTLQGTAANPLNPMVTGLTNNGGPLAGAVGNQMAVETEALIPGSPAIGKGVTTPTTPPITDERGAPRVNKVDVGAFQFEDVTLQLTIGTQTTLTLGNTETITVTVTNISGNPLPSDNSTLTVATTGGLNIGGVQVLTLGPLAAGQSQTFSFNATGVGLGGQIIAASITSVDANPNTTSTSTPVNVVPQTTPTPTPTPTPMPSTFQAAITLFIDAFELVLSLNGFPSLPPSSVLFASIQTNLPFADGLAIPALIAGANAANNTLGNT